MIKFTVIRSIASWLAVCFRQTLCAFPGLLHRGNIPDPTQIFRQNCKNTGWLGPTKENPIISKTEIIPLDVGTLVFVTVTPVGAFFSGGQRGSRSHCSMIFQWHLQADRWGTSLQPEADCSTSDGLVGPNFGGWGWAYPRNAFFWGEFVMVGRKFL